MAIDGLTNDDIKHIRDEVKTIAVVGLSPKPHRASHQVALYLQQQGYQIIPVHPQHKIILGLTCYATLAAIPINVDMVDCFRAAEAMPALADEVIAIGAKVMWMQLDIYHADAAAKARDAGIMVVMDRCPKIEFPKLN
ncbi:CoA-binding protein [Candidatus Njordibacter sp. Uisw_056]|jgi:predicted CoA-binding protein|uniref:CoA-binding protein n=1 Tax=Candidatus Njordibacter sp. Uisw_056 TaxID=3230973 RepID=UPI003D3C5996|tara:strand:+ start:7 stop:420 length:414 start_codon:yes stop_codon:yes gene_type:complete